MRRNKLDKRQRWLARNNFFPCSCKNCKPRNVVRRMKVDRSDAHSVILFQLGSYNVLTLYSGVSERKAILSRKWDEIPF